MGRPVLIGRIPGNFHRDEIVDFRCIVSGGGLVGSARGGAASLMEHVAIRRSLGEYSNLSGFTGDAGSNRNGSLSISLGRVQAGRPTILLSRQLIILKCVKRGHCPVFLLERKVLARHGAY